jgi:pimeloyl-ACP methyl ester carboxylesterase
LLAALVLVDITPKVEPKGIERIMRFMLDKPEGFESLEEAAESVARYRQHRAKPSDLSGLRKNLRHGEDGRWRWHWDPAFVNRAHGQQMLAEGVDAAEVQDFMNGKALMEAARSLSVPVLLVRGKVSDVVSADGADEFLDAVPHARYADVAGAGHMVAGDRNDAFNDAVLGFLRDAFA